ncbi:hypothetical protein LVJ94_17135 [Pendulispora rubella]|uniref:Uncharacterized protein n=1 Tax=Pendulispora rubella TaxID=2741070 RepID=A0ABZ2LDD6_9BACT
MARANSLAPAFAPRRTAVASSEQDLTRVLSEYEETVAATQRILTEIHDGLRRLAVAITRREDARAALERLQVRR